MKIEVGKFYLTRDGKRAGPVRLDNPADTGHHYPFRARIDGDSHESSYTRDGSYSTTLQSNYDLVAALVSETVDPAFDGEELRQVKSCEPAPLESWWWVMLNRRCTPMLRQFATQREMVEWVGRFTLAHLGNEDNWIDGCFYGSQVTTTLPIEVGDDPSDMVLKETVPAQEA